MMIKKCWIYRNGKNGRCVPAGKCGNEKLHEGVETAEPRGYHRRNFPVPSGSDGFYSTVYQREKQRPDPLHMTARSLEPILSRLMAVSFIRNRLCRSFVILRDIPWDEATLCAVPCQEKSDVMEKERQNFVYGNEEEFRAVSQTALTRKTAKYLR